MNWRFIPYQELDGATNMAVDEALLEGTISGASPPVLRLYGFAPPTITIGFNQKFDPALIASIEKQGINVVRRPTGGRAVLHLNDLTYSFTGLTTGDGTGFLSSSVSEAYKQICEGLKQAFTKLGIETALGNAGGSYRDLQDCFHATTNCDLHHNGLKMIGSAQLRRRSGVLQHGSLLLNQDQTVMAKLLGAEVAPDHVRHANLFEVAGRTISIPELESAFRFGFETAFGIRFESSDIRHSEMKDADRLRGRYLCSADQPATLAT